MRNSTFALCILALSLFAYAEEIRKFEGIQLNLANSNQLSGIYFSEDWEGCTKPITEKVKIVSVSKIGRYEVSEFKAKSKKWGIEEYKIDLSSLPNSDKWLPATLIKEGNFVKLTTRACGSGLHPGVQSIER